MRCRRPLVLILSLMMYGVLYVPLAFAKLAPTTLIELIADSDVIMQARVVQVGEELPQSRLPNHAVLRVQRVLKGSYESEEITIRFEPELHEQFLTSLHEDRLLFLRRTEDSSYIGTHYGMSYWPLVASGGEGDELVTPYAYSTTLITMPDPLVRAPPAPIPGLGIERQPEKVIYLTEVISLLTAVEAATQFVHQQDVSASLEAVPYEVRENQGFPHADEWPSWWVYYRRRSKEIDPQMAIISVHKETGEAKWIGVQ